MDKKVVITDLLINEISAVDEPAQEHATVRLIKRKGNSLKAQGALTTEAEGHTHLIYLEPSCGESNEYENNVGDTTWQNDHSHSWVRTENGIFVIGESQSEKSQLHTHAIETLSKIKDKFTMEPEDKTEVIKRKLDRANAIIKLNANERKVFDSFGSPEKQDEFLGFSAQARSEKMIKLAKDAKDLDPVVYVTTDGLEMRKSAGEAIINMAKANDVLSSRLDASEAVVSRQKLEKRAVSEIEYLPGTMDTKVALLQGIDTLPKESRIEVLNSIRAQNSSMAKAFATEGGTSNPDGQEGSPSAKLELMAKSLVKNNPELSYELAYSKALETKDGQELYNLSLN